MPTPPPPPGGAPPVCGSWTSLKSHINSNHPRPHWPSPTVPPPPLEVQCSRTATSYGWSPVTQGCSVAAYPLLHAPPSKRQAQERARQLRKLQRADELQEVLQELVDNGIPLVYTDGSCAVEGKIGRLVGCSIYCEGHAAHVPIEYGQTNNTAKLFAVLRALGSSQWETLQFAWTHSMTF